MNDKSISIIAAGCLLLAVSPLARGQSSATLGHKSSSSATKGDTQFGFSRNVEGTLVVTSTNAQGCGTLVCTTNTTVFSGCSTNAFGAITCSNKVTKTIICSNGVATVTAYKLHQVLSGTITANPACDELDSLFPASAAFEAQLDSDVRTNDWRGLHAGTFKILNGATVVATGNMTGSNGVGSHDALGELCAICSHLEGTLVGTVVQAGVLNGAQIQATYAADLTDVVCPSADIPAGDVALTLDGVVVSRKCPAP